MQLGLELMERSLEGTSVYEYRRVVEMKRAKFNFKANELNLAHLLLIASGASYSISSLHDVK
jgi:hypothetical protein